MEGGNMAHKTVRDADIVNFTSRLVFGAALVAVGVIFLLMRFDERIARSEWWVVFIYVFGIGTLIGAGFGYYRNQAWTALEITMGIVGVLAVLVALIFTFDPTWSFTRDWSLFSGVDWNLLWPLIPLLFGAGLLLVPFMRRRGS
jgi:FtsH-binding integral membrane protein